MEEKGHFINALPDSGLVTFLAVVREREQSAKKVRRGLPSLAARRQDRRDRGPCVGRCRRDRQTLRGR